MEIRQHFTSSNPTSGRLRQQSAELQQQGWGQFPSHTKLQAWAPDVQRRLYAAAASFSATAGLTRSPPLAPAIAAPERPNGIPIGGTDYRITTLRLPIMSRRRPGSSVQAVDSPVPASTPGNKKR